MRLAGLLCAAGAVGPVDWPGALQWVVTAAEFGDDQAREELVLLAPDSEVLRELSRLASEDRPFAKQSWIRLAETIDLQALLAAPSSRLVCQKPQIAVSGPIASGALCAWLIARSRRHLAPARIVVGGSERALGAGEEPNSMVEFGLGGAALPLLALRQRIAAVVGVPVETLEDSRVLHYAPGQTYRPHYDSLPPEAIADERHLALGQRPITVLVYLNQDYEAGETDFPRLNWKFKGAPGQALFWRNTLENSREIDRETLHAGLAPASGEKWVLSQWIRERSAPIGR